MCIGEGGGNWCLKSSHCCSTSKIIIVYYDYFLGIVYPSNTNITMTKETDKNYNQGLCRWPLENTKIETVEQGCLWIRIVLVMELGERGEKRAVLFSEMLFVSSDRPLWQKQICAPSVTDSLPWLLNVLLMDNFYSQPLQQLFQLQKATSPKVWQTPRQSTFNDRLILKLAWPFQPNMR